MCIIFYDWFSESLEKEFETQRILKKSERSTISLLCHRNTGQPFILRSFTGNAEVYQKLLSCRCPYLPTTYEAVSKDGHSLVLEEYIHGDNMGEMLKESLFTPEEMRPVILNLCKALWVLHSLGAVHRDVKPENVILRGSDAVLIDFDAARIYKDGHENDTVILGTTGFAPPEQYGLSQSDGRSDIYSLGILINVMLTGQHPTARLADGRFGRIVTRCTQVNPDKRYKNVLRLMDEL